MSSPASGYRGTRGTLEQLQHPSSPTSDRYPLVTTTANFNNNHSYPRTTNQHTTQYAPGASIDLAPVTQESTNEGGPKPPPAYQYPPQPSSHPRSASGDDFDQGSLRTRLRSFVRFPCSMYGKAMIIVIAVEAALVIAMQAVIVALYFQSLVDHQISQYSPYLDPQNQSRAIPAYMIVFVFAQLFQLVFVWDAVRAQNTIELISIVAFNFCCFAYSAFEISQSRNSLTDAAEKGFFIPESKATDLQKAIEPFLIVVVAVIGVTQCLVTWLAYQLFQEFGWKIYKKIGADPNIKRMFRAYQIYLVLIKVDFFFFVGFSIQFIYLTLTKRAEDPEYWLTIFVLPLTIVILYIAVYAVRHESRKWMSVFLVAMLCGVVYFIFKVIRMFVNRKESYEGVYKFLTLFASLCLVTIFLTIANAIVCYRNFGKGLKPHLNREAQGFQTTTAVANERVIEID
ncbi:hypothetical protein B0O80DRAFT_462960 [Mortierella sp. GBAus27b]|nr:hypothetical protein B0O80DRAFT_462960 [Mortierella sp. GBAus27b]